jgi:recombination protein RecT
MTETVTQAVAKRDNAPTALIEQYSTSFASVLPSHVKPETWVRLAQGALKKGKRINAPNPKAPDHVNHTRFELEVAAANNPGVFLASLLDAARLGLTPGSEEYYLTPRKVAGRLEILGIVGYQGYVELMYRAGAVGSVVVQVVRENDTYRYDRGIDECPVHQFPPFAREATRGPLLGTYAYARMKDGALSQVVELNIDDIERIKKANPASGGEYSPWVKWEASMWMKSAARQLRKWVPTSAEYRRELARTTVEAQRVTETHDLPAPPAEVDVLDGEVVEDWPETAVPGGEE